MIDPTQRTPGHLPPVNTRPPAWTPATDKPPVLHPSTTPTITAPPPDHWPGSPAQAADHHAAPTGRHRAHHHQCATPTATQQPPGRR